ncbi:HAF family extracellular repeat protein [Ignavibacterium album JCM 16511]|uniref:HAF family extracellular repeat protein n=1 Tax=Ignavibacterium album (strain DSM 19864 / JCM 16511 / NBRC 101810 / Mat9-16) TaxID=945713 RepID=I0AM35_IGNAJ|nr:VCBS repeat-containing protein [Ignavibacterium album]AFH50042.1 HAF family extracellular repeat protein [Ignavibacterium album JCM 16511]
MRLKFVCCLLFVVSGFLFSQNRSETREEKLEQLTKRTDIKVTEVEKDILRLEYPSGKVLYKNIGDYVPINERNITYSPTFDSTIIDLTTIDTSLYYHKYSFWQEVPISNLQFDYLRIDDVNNNGKPELYGARKYFSSSDLPEPVTVYELNNSEIFYEIFQYDTVVHIQNIYDVNRDGKEEVHFTPSILTPNEQRFYSKPTDTTLATNLDFVFNPDLPYQLDDPTLGNFDGDQQTDLVFDKASNVYIFEYNHIINNFDSVYHFQVPDPIDLGIGGYSVGDFDLDGKTDIVFSTVRGKVFVIENEGNNQYNDVWQGSVESNNAYVHTWTNDIDRNGKPEFWVLADAYYNGIGTTRITIFETNGDNSYQAVGRIDLVGIMSFYAGNMQAIDIDNDGTEEIAVCIDDNFIILEFNGRENHHTYEVYYIKKNELNTEEEYQVYMGAIMYNLQSTSKYAILISMYHTKEVQPNLFNTRYVTKIYKPDSTTSINGDEIKPIRLKILQNYPNPFNPSTTVKFELNQMSIVSIKVFNILGKEVTTLLNKELSPGIYTINWEAKDSNGQLLPSGVYLIKLSANNETGNYTRTIKSLLLK